MKESLDRYAARRLNDPSDAEAEVREVPAPVHLSVNIEPSMDGVYVYAPDSKAQANSMWGAMVWLTLILLGGATGFGMLVWPEASDWVVGGGFAVGVVALIGLFAGAYLTGVPEGLRIRGDRAFVVAGSGQWSCDVSSLQVNAWTFDVTEGEDLPRRTYGYLRVTGPVDGADLFRGHFDQYEAEQLAAYLQWCVAVSLRRDRGAEDDVPEALGRLVDRD